LIPGVAFYVLSAALIGFGGWRFKLSFDPSTPRRGYHRLWGAIYVIVGVWLLLTQLGIVPMLHGFGRGSPRAP
jgi:hypothetical protein